MNVKFSIMLLIRITLCKHLPSFVEVCHRSDPMLTECVTRNIEMLRPRLLKGIPELQIPSFNPLTFTKAALQMGKDFTAEFSDIQIYGIENFVLETVDCDVKNLRFEIAALFPKLTTTAKYKMRGKIMILQLNSDGYVDGNYTNVRAQMKAQNEFHMKKGKKHLKVNNANTSVEIGHINIYFDRIFGDNEALNTQVNKIFNDNEGALTSELKSLINVLLRELNMGIMERLYDKYSFDDLFPNP